MILQLLAKADRKSHSFIWCVLLVIRQYYGIVRRRHMKNHFRRSVLIATYEKPPTAKQFCIVFQPEYFASLIKVLEKCGVRVCVCVWFAAHFVFKTLFFCFKWLLFWINRQESRGGYTKTTIEYYYFVIAVLSAARTNKCSAHFWINEGFAHNYDREWSAFIYCVLCLTSFGL